MPEKPDKSLGTTERVYGAGHKLIGKNYQTPDLYAKVTGQAKYAEDYHAEGMLFCKLLLSPLPHARVKHLDVSRALALPGVKAILTADELPPPADTLTDNGTVIRANPKSERGLNLEPLYQGEPILAVAAVDELTAAEAIEKIRIEFEPLPFAIDPLETLRPGGPNPRTEGNIWVKSPTPAAVAGAPPPAPPPPTIGVLKWTDADFAEEKKGRLPMGKTPDEWSYGDVQAGFQSAALVLDETFVTPDTSHQTLETRSALAYWRNGKVYVHTGTQSTAQTVPAIARWLNIDVSKVVLISEYTGGGFGSKITAGVSLIIPALLSKKANAPVMMRISREEETFIGRARPSLLGRMKVGFSKDGRIIALDMFVIANNGPYDAVGDAPTSGRIVSLLYQPQAMRWRGVTILTNTPPRSAQSSPGGIQGITIMEPIIAKAGRKLGIDQVAIRRINCPEGKAPFGPAVQRAEATRHECVPQGSARPGSGTVSMERKGLAHAEADRYQGARRRRLAQLFRRWHDRLRWDSHHQARWPNNLPIWNRQPGDGIGERRSPGRRRGFGSSVGEVRRYVGRLIAEPSVHLCFRRQPDDPRNDTRGVRDRDGRQAEAPGNRGEEVRRQARGLRCRQRARIP